MDNRFRPGWLALAVGLLLGYFALASELAAADAAQMDAFRAACDGKWKAVFSDPCTEDWKKRWTLDGEHARITHDAKGVAFQAGPEYRNDAHHAVLWTKESFKGDLRIDYEYTKLDQTITGAVTILYVQATGSGKGPYVKDLSKWAHLRKIPSMKTYFNNMNTLHISYAAFPTGLGNKDPGNDYIRARRYMPLRNAGRLQGTELKPDYKRTGLFKPGVPHRITVIKRGQTVFMHIRGPERELLCRWKNSLAPILEGRIGLRHMYTRAARYRKFRIALLAEGKPDDAGTEAEARGAAGEKEMDAQKGDDISILKQRLVQDLMPEAEEAQKLLADVKQWQASMKPDGSWADVDYTNKDTKSRWESAWHTKRLFEMARMYAAPDLPLSGSRDVVDKIKLGMTYWLAKEVRARGWYHQQLFVPHNLGNICLLLGKEMSEDHRKAAIKRLRERSSFDGKQNLRTGSNLLTFARNNVLLGCLAHDSKPIARAFKLVAKELRISDQEGIQVDLSFYQHGALPQAGAYGANFSLNFIKLAWLGQGTAFKLSEDKLKLLFRFVLDGQQWVIRGPEFDYLTTGRTFTRQHEVHKPGSRGSWQYLARIEGPRSNERRDFVARLEGARAPGESAPTGNRMFWRSDLMVHRRKGWYASVRMLSQDVANTDAVNYENIYGHHVADGAMCLMRTGNEYRALYPLWNWRAIPGTTVEEGNPSFAWKNLRTQGVRAFVGGVSDGEYGVAAMDFARGPETGAWVYGRKARRINAKAVTLTARKAWFFFDRQAVCLGSGITGKSGKPVRTTLNQCRLNGAVSVSENAKLAAKGGSVSGPAWIHHDGFGYLIPGQARIQVERLKKSGNWEDINKSRPGRTISDSVFNLYLDHGKAPTGADYCYHIVPGIEASGMETYAKEHGIEVLANTAKLQAVRNKTLGMISAVFYTPGKLEVPGGGAIQASAGCILLVREMPKNGLRVAFSKPDPSGKGTTPVGVKIGKQALSFVPPRGVDQGKSLVKTIPAE